MFLFYWLWEYKSKKEAWKMHREHANTEYKVYMDAKQASRNVMIFVLLSNWKGNNKQYAESFNRCHDSNPVATVRDAPTEGVSSHVNWDGLRKHILCATIQSPQWEFLMRQRKLASPCFMGKGCQSLINFHKGAILERHVRITWSRSSTHTLAPSQKLCTIIFTSPWTIVEWTKITC